MQYAHPPINEAYPIVRVGYPSPEYGCAPFAPECGCESVVPLVPDCGCRENGLGDLSFTINWPQAAVGALVGIGLGYVFFATR